MSHEDVPPDPRLTEVEAALKSLAPAPNRVDRDLVMYRAGQASARTASQGRRAWMATAAGLALLATVEAALLACRPGPTVVERVVLVHEPAPAAAPRSDIAATTEPLVGMEPTAYQRLTWQVSRYGLDGLPASPSVARQGAPTAPPSARRLLIEELRNVLEPGDPS
jgi:hypothetical protein